MQRDTSAPTLFLYPTPDAADTFKYYGLTKIQDAGDYNDQLEVPTRFIPCLTSGLAYYVSIKKAPERTALLKQLYEEEWNVHLKKIDHVLVSLLHQREVIFNG